MERVVFIQLETFIENLGIYEKFQSGFETHHITEIVILRVLNDLLAVESYFFLPQQIFFGCTLGYIFKKHNIHFNLFYISGIKFFWQYSNISAYKKKKKNSNSNYKNINLNENKTEIVMFGQSDSLDDSDGILSPSSNMTNRSLSSCLLLCHNYCIILYYCCVTYFYICLFWYFKPDQ